MGGSVFFGLFVFGVLLIVNFMVITKGATRMAEVGARFALDGMPGKQLAIDSDMSAGAIDHAEAKIRRDRDQQETTFFGSLDGASKFVKGDAVAGVLITLLNFVMDLIMGAVVHDMPLGQASETLEILTVGDGLVSQIPVVIISIAAALLLARGGAIGSTDLTLFSQLGRHPAALLTVGLLMLMFALVPGLPFLPFLLGGAGLLVTAWIVQKRQASDVLQLSENDAEDAPAVAEETMADSREPSLHFSPGLFAPLLLGAGQFVGLMAIMPAALIVLALLARRTFLFTSSKLKPKASRISILKNAKNKFGRGGLFEFAKSFVKLLVFSLCLGLFLNANFDTIVVTSAASERGAISVLFDLMTSFLSLAVLIAAVIAIIDYGWQVSEH